jgi:surface protein
MKRILIILTTIFLIGCSKEESDNSNDVQEPVSFELEENILGKWDVSNNTTNPFEREEVIIHSVVFNSDKSFKINYSDGTIEGNYKVDSETELTLENVGKLTNTSISNQSMTSKLSLNNIVDKSLEGNGDSDFKEGDCTTLLDCMNGKVFGETSIFKIDLNSEKIESSFIYYEFGSENPCCHFESEYFEHDISSNDNLEVDIFEHTLDHVSLYFETNCCDDFIIRYRIDEFGNFVEERLSENTNQYNLEYSREETTQTVLDNMLQEYGGNVVCEPIDESETFIEKQNGKYWKYSHEDFNWYLKFTDNPDEYITLYHNVNDTEEYHYFNSSKNSYGINFVNPPVVDYTQKNGTFFDGHGTMFWGDEVGPGFNISFSINETSCGQIYISGYEEPIITDWRGPKNYVLGFSYFNDNGIQPGNDGHIIFEEISQSDFEDEVLDKLIQPIYLDSNGVTIKCREYLPVGFVGELYGIEYTVGRRSDISTWISEGRNLNQLCTTLITSMEYGFSNGIPSDFNGDISNWDVSNVTYMYGLFINSDFNGDISNWDVSSVIKMGQMFHKSQFNGDISNWDVSSVTDMYGMFTESQFNQDLNSWDVSSVTDMDGMFTESQFNQDLNSWDVSSVESMGNIFHESQFNGDISNWDVTSVTNMSDMFSYSTFNQNISNWDVSNVGSMSGMFQESMFNQDLSNWDVSSVIYCNSFSYNTPNWTLPKPNFTNCNP